MAKEKLVKKMTLRGKIEVLSGLHIGGTDNILEIGGVSNSVIKIERNNRIRPYIPGSSLKGKMRSLIEHLRGEFFEERGELHSSRDPAHPSARIFGTPAGENEEQAGFYRPSRIIVRDAFFIDPEETIRNSSILEVKSENSISRITAKANPRPMERVLPGTSFDMEIVLNIFDTDLDKREDALDQFKNDEERILGYTLIGMKLIEEDYLGGGGSRGNGKVKFHLNQMAIKTAEDYSSFSNGIELSLENMKRPESMKEFEALMQQLSNSLNSGEDEEE